MPKADARETEIVRFLDNGGSDEEEMDHDDSAPLVTSRAIRRQRGGGTRNSASFFNKNGQENYDQDEDLNCWNDSWKFIASMILTALLLIPYLYSYFEHYLADSGSDNNSTTSQLFSKEFPKCSKRLNWDKDDMIISMREESQSFCRGNQPSMCRYCELPFQPRPKNNSNWHRTFQRNVQLLSTELSTSQDLDIVFLGDSIVENWMGTVNGVIKANNKPIQKVFNETFRTLSSKYKGLASGISGDSSPQLLYRFQNGELPPTLNPSIFWLVIGANDLKCTVPTVLSGIINAVEYLLKQKTDAIVVINSLLPCMVQGKKASKTPLIHVSSQVNEKLECYTFSHPRLAFFNATDIFVQDDVVVGMREYVHPNAEGSKAWLNKVVETMDQLITS